MTFDFLFIYFLLLFLGKVGHDISLNHLPGEQMIQMKNCTLFSKKKKKKIRMLFATVEINTSGVNFVSTEYIIS